MSIKIKKKQFKSKNVKSKANLNATFASKDWEKVKIKGKVISDDVSGFEGLIGLEVLKDYDSQFVKKGSNKYINKKQNSSDTKTNEKNIKKKRKNIVNLEEVSELQNESEYVKKRKQKKKRKPNPTDHVSENNEAKELSIDRFALLRPPPDELEEEDEENSENENEIPQLVEVATNAIDLDNLTDWNGLGVPNVILRALAEKGFNSPTEIQTMTLPAAILGKKDILGAAETGSGKTLAFGIPILTGILELKAKNAFSGIRKPNAKKHLQPEPPKKKIKKTLIGSKDRELTPPPGELKYFPKPQKEDSSSESENEDNEQIGGALYALVLTPTRELAVQVKDHLVAAAKYTGINIAALFGGLSVAKQERLLRKCPEIVVATPGRLWELYEQQNPHLSKIDDISFLVIDETDRMVEKGHFEELRSLLKVLNADEQKKEKRQNFVFSATLTLVHDLPDHMRKRNKGKQPKFVKQTPGLKLQSLIEELGISQPKIVDITRSQQTAQSLTECRIICSIEHKDYYLYYFLQRHPGRTIVFSNSIDCVKRLSTLFGLLECNPLPLHANMIQKQRLKNLERFRDSPNGLLIATDVAARGLDIPNVEHVIHYQVPRTSENYVHRSGRTARANKNGITVLLMEPGEVKNYVKLYKTLDRSEDLPIFPVSERFFSAVKERVNLAREVDKQELKLKRTQSEIGWMKKRAEEMDIIIDGYNDDSDQSDQDDEDAFIIERRRNRVQLDTSRSQLRNLLKKPIFSKGYSFKYPTASGKLEMPDISAQTTDKNGEGCNTAVKVMMKAIEDRKLAKKIRNKRNKT